MSVETSSTIFAGGFPIADWRAELGRRQARLAERFQAGEPVTHLVHARSRDVDKALTACWQHFLGDFSPASLIAVGGYGRGELHPASDIDILVLVPADDDSLATPITDLITALWDLGLEIGHSVRTLEETIAAAVDLSVITNLTETRLVAGNQALHQQLISDTAPERLWPSDRFFTAKLDEQRERHRKFGNTAYNLEPNLKENPGGLRDIQMIGWVAKRHFGATRMQDLVTCQFLTDQEYHELSQGQELLWRIRFALHQVTGRHEDRLLFEHQRTLAKQFGYQDDDGNLGVEQFMQRYYRTVMRLNRLNELLLQLFEERILYGDDSQPVEVLNPRFQVRNNHLEVCNAGLFIQHPLALLELVLMLARVPDLAGVSAGTIRLIRAHRHLIDDRLRRDPRAHKLFLAILRQPKGVFPALRLMNRYGILARYIAPFTNIVGRMQFDLFHVYTVDEHTLMLLRNVYRFGLPEFAEEAPLCSQVFAQLPKPELLYLAGLFHDIAKGRGGDHSKLGETEAWTFCKQHGLSDYDACLVSWLVRQHLQMSMTAQRRDIEDPEVVQDFAAVVAEPVRLDYLYLLTVADVRATSPARWNSWKASLMGQLYHSTRRALARGLDNPSTQNELVQAKQGEAKQILARAGYDLQDVISLWMTLSLDYFLYGTPIEIAHQTQLVLAHRNLDMPLIEVRNAERRGATEIFICLRDTDRLFLRCCHALDNLDLSVQEARIQSTDYGCAMNSFFVLDESHQPIADPARRDHIRLELIRMLRHPNIDPPARVRRLPRRLREFDQAPQLAFEPDTDNHRTLLRLKALDRPGLLAMVGDAFANHAIRVVSARISTLGAMAEDSFILTDWDNQALMEDDQLAALREDLCLRLAPEKACD